MFRFSTVARVALAGVFSVVFLSNLASAAVRTATLHLNDGASISGPVIHEHPDRIFIDLGFTLLSVPRGAIAEIVERDGDDGVDGVPSAAGDSPTLYRTLKNREVRSVDDWAKRLGETVVLIRTNIGLGSGFVIDPSGHLVTNNHVISGEREISATVFVRDGDTLRKENYDGLRIIATNPLFDLALLKIDAPQREPFAFAPLGDSAMVRQGQPVFAVGSPLGLERTVSKGIISNRNRPLNGMIYLQSTAEINPGNSGGPLFNLYGEVVGVNNMKVVGMGAEGLAFAVPSKLLTLFLRNRDAFAFDPRNPNAGFRYYEPPTLEAEPEPQSPSTAQLPKVPAQ